MAALFCAGLLVLEMHARGTGLDKHLGELHHRGGAAVTRVRVGDDRWQKIHRGLGFPLLRRHFGEPVSQLLAVVKELGLEKLVHFVRHRVHGVIGQVGAGLVRGGARRRALPPTHVHGRQILGHLHHLHRVECAKGRGGLGILEEAREEAVRFLGLSICKVAGTSGALKPRHILGAVFAHCALPPVLGPPCLHLPSARLKRCHLWVLCK